MIISNKDMKNVMMYYHRQFENGSCTDLVFMQLDHVVPIRKAADDVHLIATVVPSYSY